MEKPVQTRIAAAGSMGRSLRRLLAVVLCVVGFACAPPLEPAHRQEAPEVAEEEPADAGRDEAGFAHDPSSPHDLADEAASSVYVLYGSTQVCGGVDEVVTCNGRFPDAEPPYAQRPDGCSSISDNPQQVRDKWGSADFRPTCNQHDRCYYTPGSRAADCNTAFCEGLNRACLRAYSVKVGSRYIPGPLYPACLGIASTYCAAVVAAQGVVHPKAQRIQSEWEQCYQEGLARPKPPPKKDCGRRAHNTCWTVSDCDFAGGGEVMVDYLCDDGRVRERGRTKTGRNCL